jgi:hypothetical protein
MEELPILVVASLSIDANDLSIREDPAILKLQGGRIVPILSELMQSLIIEPVSPRPREPINRLIDVLCREVLHVHGPCIVVALDRVDGNIWRVEDSLDGESDIFGSIAHFKDIVRPHVVRGIVACPEEDVGLYYISHILKHVIESSRRKITLVWSEESSLPARISWEPIVLAAAQEPPAFRVSPYSVLEVDMGVSDLHSLQSLARLSAGSNLFINLIQIVIVLEWVGLGGEQLVDPILTIE